MAKLELFGSQACPYTKELRHWLEWRRREFVEYDVEHDAAARRRLLSLASGLKTIPVLVEEGKVIQIGWQGRTCVFDGD